MKKILLAAVLFVAAIAVNAQEITSTSMQDSVKVKKVYFGVKGGLNISSLSANGSRMIPGFQLGVFSEFELSKSFAIQPGLNFTYKGGEFETYEGNTYKTKIVERYLELPVMGVYKISLAPGTLLTLNLGPYISYGVSGMYDEVHTDGHHAKQNIFSDTMYKKLDYGIAGGVGLESNNVLINLGYEAGLANLAQASLNTNGSIKNKNFFLTVGYKF